MGVYRKRNITYECLLSHQLVSDRPSFNDSDGVFNERKILTFNEEVIIFIEN